MEKSPGRGGGRFLSIKSRLVGALTLLAALFLIPTTIQVYQSYLGLAESRLMAELLKTGIDLFQAVRNLGYERGRTNVVLNHAGPLEQMAANRQFVRDRRREGEAALASATTALAQTRVAGIARPLAALERSREQMRLLRSRADAEMILTKDQRSPELPGVWFAAMNEMILAVRGLLEIACHELAKFGGQTAVVSQFMLTSVGLRDEAAPEMSLLSGVMLSERPMTREMHLRIVEQRGKSQQLLSIMHSCNLAINSPRISELAAKFHGLYCETYLPLGREVLEASLTGGPYRLSQPEFLDIGVKAIEALMELMEAVVEEGGLLAEEARGRALRRFLLSISLFALGDFLIVLAILIVVHRIINPLAALTAATRRVARRELDLAVPYLGRTDEIGAVARAVEVLKDNTERMIADNAALQEANAKLEQALSEVRTLSGLLPICASCKKIRDDQGYWQQLEVYLGRHSDAQFSHGICPECVRKLYPDYSG